MSNFYYKMFYAIKTINEEFKGAYPKSLVYKFMVFFVFYFILLITLSLMAKEGLFSIWTIINIVLIALSACIIIPVYKEVKKGILEGRSSELGEKI